MTDTVQQAAAAVKTDVIQAATAEATGGVVAAATDVAGDVAHIAGQALVAGSDAVTGVAGTIEADTAPVEAEAETLFGKIKGELVGLVDWTEEEFDKLKAAIAKHL